MGNLTQQEVNIKIAEILLELSRGDFGKHLRFQQILFITGITEFSKESKEAIIYKPTDCNLHMEDKYNERSIVTYLRLKEWKEEEDIIKTKQG